HEVGAVDAIIDVAASMVAMKELCITSVASSPVATGTGLVETAHGQMPLPAPAVAELLTGVPIYSTTLQNELATPTGAAILVSCATSFGELPLFQLAGIGYGAGSRELPIPNVLRVFLGTTVQRQEEIMVIESTLDTADGESLAYLMEKLLDAGALDAWFTPVYMKKGRPGVTLTALTLPGLETKAADVIFSEGLTLGVRIEKKLRVVARREIVDVQTSLGPVKVKVARYNQSIISIRPEFEDCRKIARDGNLPLAEARKRLTEEAAALLGFEQRPPADR
ncbi:MAG: nickel pincer cofactor biosynthesis protein LarC, partial [Chloroflexi bacterium]|nr:nickel pincer cofactor biosynthesis protein LarC [Chloroflexota bacterium]